MLADKQPKRALGRGLSALIPQASAPPPVPVEVPPPPGRAVLKIAVESIVRDQKQPRRLFDEGRLAELAESIKAQGLIQPILVRREGSDYRIIAGERRWRAAQLAGLTEVAAIVREVTDTEAFELALVENLQREDLNPIEEAEGYRRLIEEFALTQEQVSQRVGKDRTSVTNALRLLGLPEEVKEMLASGTLSMGQARALLGVPRIPEMVQLAARVAEEKLSVRDVERLVKAHKSSTGSAGGTVKKSSGAGSVESRAVVEELQRILGTKVRLQDHGGKGTLEIDFFSYQDLDRLLDLLRK